MPINFYTYTISVHSLPRMQVVYEDMILSVNTNVNKEFSQPSGEMTLQSSFEFNLLNSYSPDCYIYDDNIDLI